MKTNANFTLTSTEQKFRWINKRCSSYKIFECINCHSTNSHYWTKQSFAQVPSSLWLELLATRLNIGMGIGLGWGAWGDELRFPRASAAACASKRSWARKYSYHGNIYDRYTVLYKYYFRQKQFIRYDVI